MTSPVGERLIESVKALLTLRRSQVELLLAAQKEL
jgi:hypothetical protein